MIYSGGTLTNIALAVRMDPEFASLAKGLVIMGGYIDVNLYQASGSVNQADINSDINLMLDPEATKIALTASFPNISKCIHLIWLLMRSKLIVTAIVGNAANQVFPDQEYLDTVYQVKNKYTTLMYNNYGTIFPFWDETAMFAVLDPSNVINSTQFYLDVDTAWSSPSYGTVHVYQQALMPRQQTLQLVNYVYEVDAKKLKSSIKRAVQYPTSCEKMQRGW